MYIRIYKYINIWAHVVDWKKAGRVQIGSIPLALVFVQGWARQQWDSSIPVPGFVDEEFGSIRFPQRRGTATVCFRAKVFWRCLNGGTRAGAPNQPRKCLAMWWRSPSQAMPGNR